VETRKRIRALRTLGVKSIEFAGGKVAGNVPVLGKGCTGVVVIAHTDRGKNALKIRRADVDQDRLQHEGEMLRRANEIDVGPTLINVTENFLLMQLIQGTLFPQWVEARKGNRTRSEIRRILKGLLDQCYRLDSGGIDHGELSNASKHVIVDRNILPHILDFESASLNRRVSNVTSICHYLFLGSRIATVIKRSLGGVDEHELVGALRAYKHELTDETFQKIYTVCGLDAK
jgi:putative serine/threonine protein kinase